MTDAKQDERVIPGPQRGPASVAQINAQVKSAANELTPTPPAEPPVDELVKSLEWLARGTSFDVDDARREMLSAAKLIRQLRTTPDAEREVERLRDRVKVLTNADDIWEKYCGRLEKTLIEQRDQLATVTAKLAAAEAVLKTFQTLAQLSGDSTEAFRVWANDREQHTTWRPDAEELGNVSFFWSCGWQWSAKRMATFVATEAEMHAAWRKRAEEAEAENAKLREALEKLWQYMQHIASCGMATIPKDVRQSVSEALADRTVQP